MSCVNAGNAIGWDGCQHLKGHGNIDMKTKQELLDKTVEEFKKFKLNPNDFDCRKLSEASHILVSGYSLKSLESFTRERILWLIFGRC